MEKNKNIVFILDSFALYIFTDSKSWPRKTLCYSYFDTEEAINNKMDNIITYDLGHLSFDLENLGYHIFIGYNGHTKEFYTGMSTANGKELRFAHNLRKLLIGGALDNDLNIERKKIFWYDKSKSTSKLCEEEEFKNKLLPLVTKVAEKTIGFNISGTKAMTPEESYEWHKKHSRIDPKTGNLIISNDEIGDGSYEQKYKCK